jgi:hypothetical protein
MGFSGCDALFVESVDAVENSFGGRGRVRGSPARRELAKRMKRIRPSAIRPGGLLATDGRLEAAALAETMKFWNRAIGRIMDSVLYGSAGHPFR